MRGKFVVRLLDADGRLLGWAEVQAEPRPQREAASCPWWPVTATQFLIEQAGTVARMAVHWTDLDVARVRDVEPMAVSAGQVVAFTWIEPVWLVPGMRDVPLPAVTARASVVLCPAPGDLSGVAGGVT